MAMDMDPPISPTTTHPPDTLINPAASLSYWNSVSADTTGMLGGFPQTSRIDLQGSSNFLTKLRRRSTAPGGPAKPLPRLNRAADCGAGVGRVTNGVLRNVAHVVDVIEPVAKFTDELLQGITRERTASTTNPSETENENGVEKGDVGAVVNLGLQDWTPTPNTYDLIWNQWCLGHLTDAQLVAYLERCKDGLVADGPAWIVVKENMSTDAWKRDVFDEVDSSVTRSDDKYRELFERAGLKVVAAEVQRGFPRELFPVRMYALRPV